MSYNPMSPSEISRIASRRLARIADAAENYPVVYSKFVKAQKVHNADEATYTYFDSLGYKLDAALANARRHRDWLAVAWFELLLNWVETEIDRSLKVADKSGTKVEALDDELCDLENTICDAY